MKKIITFLFVLAITLFISCFSKRNSKKPETQFTITGRLMETRDYCGGAVPTPELLAICNTPAGISMGKLFIKKGNFNKGKSPVIDSIVADKEGKFSIQLPAGTYCLVEDWKAKPFLLPENDEMQTVDSACYKNLYDACDYQLTVTDKNIDSVKIIFHRTCAWKKPCIEYHGPLPPVAHPH